MNPREDAEEFLKFLRDLKGEEILFKPNPGNAGDSVIAEATIQVFHTLKLKWTLISKFDDEDLSNKVVIFGGGGSLTSLYTNLEKDLDRVRDAKHIVVLPHTISHYGPLLGSLGRRVTICCREPLSFEYVKRHVPKGRRILTPDMAFHLDTSLLRHTDTLTFLTRCLPVRVGRAHGKSIHTHARTLPQIRKTIGRTVRHQFFSRSMGAPGVLNAFRRDRETKRNEVPRDNFDLSTVYELGTTNRKRILLATEAFVTAIDKYREVRTDRLHVAIVACLLGKSVIFFANSYFKNYEVFRYSLAKKYNICFRDN